MKEMNGKLIIKMMLLNMEIKQRKAKNNMQQAMYKDLWYNKWTN